MSITLLVSESFLPYDNEIGVERCVWICLSIMLEIILGGKIDCDELIKPIGKLLEDPKSVSLEEVKTFGTLLKGHIANELLTKGVPNVNAEYLPQDEMRRYERLTSVELMENNPPDNISFADGVLSNIYKSFTGEESETVQ